MNASNPPASSLDRWIHHPLAPWLAFAWGLAEATWFFIVPDVALTVIGCRSLRAGSKACAAALAGALVGGAFMYQAGSAAPEMARAWIGNVPAIRPPLIERVQAQLNERGLGALLIGPTLGIPYKIYAVESGARAVGLRPFLAVSIPARGIRFLLSLLLANGIARLIAPWTKRRPKTELTILAGFWAVFYTYYFVHFGW